MHAPANSRFERPIVAYFRRIGGGSLLVSLGLHLAILLLVLQWVLPYQAGDRTVGGGDNGSSAAEQGTPEQAVPLTRVAVSSPTVPDRVLALQTLVNVPVSTTPTANFTAPEVASAPKVPAAPSSGAGGGQGGGIGAEVGPGIGTGPDFFGMHTGTEVVLVLDLSGSMDQGLLKSRSYRELQNEIARTIRNFDPNVHFGLFAFSSSVSLFSSGHYWKTADAATKELAVSWVMNLQPGGGTRADLGLSAAFQFNPTTIIFVSDGEPNFPDSPRGLGGGNDPGAAARVLSIVRQLQASRHSPAIIDAIAYFAEDGQEFMQTLAKENGGTYRELR